MPLAQYEVIIARIKQGCLVCKRNRATTGSREHESQTPMLIKLYFCVSPIVALDENIITILMQESDYCYKAHNPTPRVIIKRIVTFTVEICIVGKAVNAE